MYDRARRFVSPDPVTGPFISPNTYEPYKGIDMSGRPCVSAFKATGNRDSFLPKHANPPVGCYNVKHPRKSVIGCCTVRSQAQRYVWTNDRNPSPSRYDTSGIEVLAGRIKKTSRFEHRMTCPTFKAPLPPLGGAPIPETENRFWNENERTGQLERMPPPDVDRTLGPAFYHVAEDYKVDRIKDSHWGNRTAFRKPILTGIEGTHTIYDVRQKPLKKRKTPRILNNPRYMTAHIRHCLRENLPGVGTYDVVITEDPVQLRALLGPDGELVHHAPFMQTAGLRRKILTREAVPGPGTYSIRWPHVKVSFNKQPPAFNVIEPRFGMPTLHFLDMAYDLPGIAEKMAADVQRSKSLRPGFNICTRRFPKPLKKDYRRLPGFLNPPEPRHPCPSAAFNSKRESKAQAISWDAPDPTKYNVIESFKASQEKKAPAPGITADELHRRGIGFWCGDRCFQDKRYVPNAEFPGPGSFDLSGNLLNDSGKFYFQNARFKEKLEITPGPGHYEIGPDIAENTVAGTLNTTLVNPQLYVRPKYFRVRPENIPISHLRALSKTRLQMIKEQRRWEKSIEQMQRPQRFRGWSDVPTILDNDDNLKKVEAESAPRKPESGVEKPNSPVGDEEALRQQAIPSPAQN